MEVWKLATTIVSRKNIQICIVSFQALKPTVSVKSEHISYNNLLLTRTTEQVIFSETDGVFSLHHNC